MGIIINPRQIIKDGITSLRDVWSSSKVSTELSGKQATLVSGVNIKTINNTSLLGSGDITISGGGDIPLIDMTATTATLDPNKFYVWGEVASLDISLAAETAGIENVYKFQFQSGATATTLTLPSSVKWSLGSIKDIQRNTTYIAVIQSNIIKIDLAYNASVLPAGYQAVEYMESTGIQSIDTNIRCDGALNFEITLVPKIGEIWGFGGAERYNSKAYGFVTRNTLTDATYLYDNNYYVISNAQFNDGQQHTMEIRDGSLYMDGNLLKTLSEVSFYSDYNIMLFSYVESGVLFKYKYRFISSRVKTDDGTIIADFRPCYRLRDNATGLYDLARDMFFFDAGFIVGPDV